MCLNIMVSQLNTVVLHKLLFRKYFLIFYSRFFGSRNDKPLMNTMITVLVLCCWGGLRRRVTVDEGRMLLTSRRGPSWRPKQSRGQRPAQNWFIVSDRWSRRPLTRQIRPTLAQGQSHSRVHRLHSIISPTRTWLYWTG